MARSKRNAAALAGWLFADLALMLSFVFLDSSATGQGNLEPNGPTTSIVGGTTTTSTPPGGVDYEPFDVKIPTRLRKTPSKLISEIERAIKKEYPKSAANSFQIVLIYVGSKDVGDTRAREIGEEVKQALLKKWTKIVPKKNYFFVGDDEGLTSGTVQMKLFPTLSE